MATLNDKLYLALVAEDDGTYSLQIKSNADTDLSLVGNVAHDAVDSGNPIKIGGYAADDTALPTPVALGDRVNAAFSRNGELFVYNTRRGAGEDQTNQVQAFVQKKLANSTYSPSLFANLGANVTLNVKASNANVFSFSCHNKNAAERFLQLFDTATTPSTGNVPRLVFPVPTGQTIVIGTDFFTSEGINFSTGLAFAFSTTEGTYTAGSAADQVTQITYT